jgi:hypothetical protein
MKLCNFLVIRAVSGDGRRVRLGWRAAIKNNLAVCTHRLSKLPDGGFHCSRLNCCREQTERKQKKKTQAAAVKKLLKNVEKKLGGEDVKATLGDYIRLMQLQKELEDEEPRDITVTWVDPKPET